MRAADLMRALLSWALLALACLPALAQQPTSTNQVPPAKVRELLMLMDDPELRQWLGERKAAGTPAAAPSTWNAPTMAADMTAPAMAVRQHILASLAALPTAIPELRATLRLLAAEIAAQGVWSTLLLVAVFLGLGLVTERVYWRFTTGFRQRLIAMPLDTVEARLGAVARRLLFGLGWIASFVLGSLGAFSCSTGRRYCTA
jgi:hypothetical protein